MASRMPLRQRTLKSRNGEEKVKPKTVVRDMRGMTAIRSSEAALKIENEELRQQLSKARTKSESAAKQMEQLEEQLKQTIHSHEQELQRCASENLQDLEHIEARHHAETGAGLRPSCRALINKLEQAFLKLIYVRPTKKLKTEGLVDK